MKKILIAASVAAGVCTGLIYWLRSRMRNQSGSNYEMNGRTVTTSPMYHEEY